MYVNMYPSPCNCGETMLCSPMNKHLAYHIVGNIGMHKFGGLIMKHFWRTLNPKRSTDDITVFVVMESCGLHFMLCVLSSLLLSLSTYIADVGAMRST